MDNAVIAQKQAAGLICVTLDVHLWSGRKRLRKESLLEKNPEFGNLPPESLATLGSIKVADPDDLAPFMRLKREAEKVLSSSGLPLLGTMGIPEAKLDRVFKKLLSLQAEFNNLRATLHRDYEVRVSEWRDKDENAGWAHLIKDIPTPEYVAGRLSFGFHMCRVSAPSVEEGSVVNELYGQQVTGLKGELFADASREARVLMDKYLTGKDPATGTVRKRDKITQKTLGPLRRVAEKLRSFSFLDSSVQPMAEVIEHCLSLLPKDGPIEGLSLVHIWTLARTLANESAAEEAAAIALQLSSPSLAFDDLLTKSVDLVKATDGNATLQASGQPDLSEAFDTPPSTAEAVVASAEEFEPDLAGTFF